MNLAYKILWFEDDSDWYDSIIEDVREVVDEFGFYFTSPQREINDSNFSSIKFDDYDLILMDFNLHNDPKGDAIIERLRQLEIYTDVIFYSSSGESFVRDKMKEKGVDGVYCVSRDVISFIPKVRKIIQTTIKKVQDINNMRGLVMAEVAELDTKMVDILNLYFSKLEINDKEAFLIDRKSKLINSLSQIIKKLDDINDNDLFNHRDFSSSHKWRSIKHIASQLNNNEIFELLSKFEEEILTKRNKLAHVKEVVNNDGSRSLQAGDFIFNDDICKSIRKDLLNHSKNLDKLSGLL